MDLPMLSASSREKPKRSATTQAHAIMTGARFTTVNLCLSASSSEISWKSRAPSINAAPSGSSSAVRLGKYSFFSNRHDEPRAAVVSPSPYLRLFRGEDDNGAGAGDEGGDDEGGSGGGGEDDDGKGDGARFICCRFFGLKNKTKHVSHMNLREIN